MSYPTSRRYARTVSAGDIFGRYTVLREADSRFRPNGARVRYVIAKCQCGTEKSVRLDSLWIGKTVSCGCYHRELTAAILPKASATHGMSRSSLHRIWCAMKARCTNPANKRWANYGGRGIRVCDEWMLSFEAFAAHVGPKPDGLSLDRINNDGHYEPGNVRWATAKEQARKTTRSLIVSYRGETMTLAEAAERGGFNYEAVRCSLKKSTPRLAPSLGVCLV